MKIAIIAISDDLENLGVRRLVSYLRNKGHHVKVFYIPTMNYHSIYHRFFPSFGKEYAKDAVDTIIEMLKGYDLIGFSSMTNYAYKVKSMILIMRQRLPGSIFLWGGIHPTVFPEDAIEHADIICRGEGELTISELIENLENGRSINHIDNLWIKTEKGVVKNPVRPLLTNEQLDQHPYMDYGTCDNYILSNNQIKPLKIEHYIQYSGSCYNTFYTLGCPFRCSYCSNDSFIELNSNYQLIRRPSIKHLLGEIKSVRSLHPYIRSIIFEDDSFFSLSIEAIQEFATSYKNEVGLPFAVLGATPISITEEKMELFVSAGMNRIRMGIQSGSVETLKLYNRKMSPESIIKASKIIAKYKRNLIPSAYDIIVDNPYESTEDLLQTIDLLDRLQPPFSLNIFSLQFLPGTKLALKAFQEGLSNPDKESKKHYKLIKPTYINLIIYAFSVFKIPSSLLNKLIRNKRVRSNKEYPIMGKILYWLMLFRRGIYHFMHRDFSLIPGKLSCYLSQIFTKDNSAISR